MSTNIDWLTITHNLDGNCDACASQGKSVKSLATVQRNGRPVELCGSHMIAGFNAITQNARNTYNG